MRLSFIGIILFGLISLVSAQEEQFDNKLLGVSADELQLSKDSLPVADFSMNVGISAFSNLEGMYGFNTYLAPQWSIMPAKKFQVDIMPYLSRTNYYNIPALGQVDATKLTLDETMLQFGVYAQGTYLISDKVYAGAAVFLNTNIPESNNSSLQGLNNYGASTYVGYRFTDNFRAEVSFGVSKNPVFYNPTPGFTPMVFPRNPYNRF
ncbi:hypothetical protein [Carboxylicivirga marina]|uniref:Outer membrane protein beta-barrel domain-containing protein n=1 Tax=Carboxylicivirga marina TaxID=2800988 RepID=A0ABS1HH90_9BACT|nr:hypothetical protein [Carboxylicivirga marina]MBK3517045.1 hypothetical protein [Carboxylicivirga marina]